MSLHLNWRLKWFSETSKFSPCQQMAPDRRDYSQCYNQVKSGFFLKFFIELFIISFSKLHRVSNRLWCIVFRPYRTSRSLCSLPCSRFYGSQQRFHEYSVFSRFGPFHYVLFSLLIINLQFSAGNTLMFRAVRLMTIDYLLICWVII